MSAVLPSSSTPVPDRLPAHDEKPNTPATAIERLTLSRERLRAAMLPPPVHSSSATAAGLSSLTSRVSEKVKAMPGANVVIDAVEAWWEKHPLRTVTEIAAEATRKFAAPLAERNPMALVFGAVFLGAVLALLRPWRWIFRPAVLAGLLPALAFRALQELPVDSWMNMFASAAAPRAKPARAQTPAEPVATAWTPPVSADDLDLQRPAMQHKETPSPTMAAVPP